MTPRDRLLAFRIAAAAVAAAFIVTGVALIYPPAAVITAGVALAVVLFIDIEPRRRA